MISFSYIITQNRKSWCKCKCRCITVLGHVHILICCHSLDHEKSEYVNIQLHLLMDFWIYVPTCTHIRTFIDPLTHTYTHVKINVYKNRHFTGMIASCLMIYTTILYFSVEIVPREGHFQLDSNSPGATAIIVLNLIFGTNRCDTMMKNSGARHSTILYCTKLYSTILYYTILY